LDVILFAWVFLLGLAVGSFLNVCIHRIPAKGLSIVKPRSHCFSCGAMIAWYDNLPLVSFLLLRGKCRWCFAPIGIRYPLIEFGTGCAFLIPVVLLLWDGGWVRDWDAYVGAAGGLVFFCGLLVASVVDLDRRIIPDEITIPGMFVGPALALFAPNAPVALFGPDALRAIPVPWEIFNQANLDALSNAVLGVVVGGASVYLIGWIFRWLLKKETMGFGDVKLLAACGGFIGWEGALMAFLLACFIGAATGIPYYFLRRSRYIPFGPSLALAAMAYFWFHPQLRYFFFHVYPELIGRIMGVPAP
jgi:leader peptidase (prepilin peptidase)/N-methyltransferase